MVCVVTSRSVQLENRLEVALEIRWATPSNVSA
jgi:hypothetical protein